MSILEALRVDLKSLSEGVATLHFDLPDEYFQSFDDEEVSGGKADVDVKISRNQDIFTLDFQTNGMVVVACDRCLEPMEQEVNANNRLIVKLGELPSGKRREATQYSDDGEIMTVDTNYGIVDLSWFVYESIKLAIPVTHVHAPGKCDAAMIELLEDHKKTSQSAARSSEETDKPVDSRWDALRKLKFDN